MSLSKQLKSNCLAIVQWNCFKLTRDRIIELSVFLQDFKPDIMSIQEVKLTQEQVNTYIKFSGYSIHYKPRKINPSHGGGVLILVNSKIAVTELSGLNLDVDHVGLKIDSNGVSFNVVSLYAPSNTLKKEIIRSYCELGDELIILGDLNAKTPVVGCRSLDANGRVLEEVINSESNLCVLNEPSRPTYFRFNNNSKKVDYSKILDLFLCSNSLANKMTSIEVLTDSKMGSDHAPVRCTLAFNKDFRQDPVEIEPRFNFTKADWVLFGSELDGMITEINCENLDDINSFDKIFSNLVNESASKAIPKFAATTLRSYPRSIVNLIKARQALRKEKKKKKKKTNSEELKILNAEFNKLTRQIKVAIKK
jgi:exonuclease III